jgi:hypothetical protein
MAQEEFARRCELERTYFKGDDIAQFLRNRYREPDPAVEARFQFRYANTHFAIATRVVSNTKVEEIYGKIADDGRRYNFITMSKQIEERIESVTTSKECVGILEMLRKLKEKYQANKEKGNEKVWEMFLYLFS